MLSTPWIAAIFAIFAWWFFTGIILLIVRRSDVGSPRAHHRAVGLTVPFFAVGIAGVVWSATTVTLQNVYISFVSVLLIWGWIELAFLSGVITGPERRPCPAGLTGWPRFVRAWHTLSYHELALLSGLLIVTVATSGNDNTFGFWTYFVLFSARVSAQLNLFFGVPRINTEFVPKPLHHIKSYFRKGNFTFVFVIGVTLLSLMAGCFAERLISAPSVAGAVGFSLLTALAALAALEHWLMVIPLPDAKLWRWMLPSAPTTSKTGQSHEL